METDEAEYSLVLQKLFPGITHYIKVFAIGDSDIIIEKSKQIIVQTSAPPDIPAVGIRYVTSLSDITVVRTTW